MLPPPGSLLSYQGQAVPSGYLLLLLRAELAHTETWVQTHRFFPGYPAFLTEGLLP